MKRTWIPNYLTYYLNLQLPRVIRSIQYRFKDSVLVYGIRCNINNMVYVGSTTDPRHRFYQHLVTGHLSNDLLQADISKYGISQFTLYIFEVIQFPSGLNAVQKDQYLRKSEQNHIDNFPASQLYNQRAAKSTTL